MHAVLWFFAFQIRVNWRSWHALWRLVIGYGRPFFRLPLFRPDYNRSTFCFHLLWISLQCTAHSLCFVSCTLCWGTPPPCGVFSLPDWREMFCFFCDVINRSSAQRPRQLCHSPLRFCGGLSSSCTTWSCCQAGLSCSMVATSKILRRSHATERGRILPLNDAFLEHVQPWLLKQKPAQNGIRENMAQLFIILFKILLLTEAGASRTPSALWPVPGIVAPQVPGPRVSPCPCCHWPCRFSASFRFLFRSLALRYVGALEPTTDSTPEPVRL